MIFNDIEDGFTGDTIELICEVKIDGCMGWDASGRLGEGNIFFHL